MKALCAFAISIAAIGLSTAPAMAADANGNHETYVWIVAGDKAIAPDGTTIFIQGQGMLTAGPGHTANGGGTFSITGGQSGHWTATAVDSFVSYGLAGPEPFFLPPGSTGGEAKLRVTLSNGQAGVLTIVCMLGTPPTAKMEGSSLVLGGGVSGNFTDEAGGNTLFIATPI
jgi:hypothetical protein